MPMNKEAEQMNQTPEGVRLQGSVLMALAIAMVIAGLSALYLHYKDIVSVEQPATTQEVQLNEEAENTEGVQGTTVPEPDSTGSSDPAEPSGEPSVEPEAYAIPAVKETSLTRCVVSTYEDGSFIQTCFPLRNK